MVGTRIFLHQGLLLSFGVLFRAVLHNFYERSYFQAPFWYDRRLCMGVAIALLLASLPFAFRLRRKEESNESGVVLLLRLIAVAPNKFCFLLQ